MCGLFYIFPFNLIKQCLYNVTYRSVFQILTRYEAHALHSLELIEPRNEDYPSSDKFR